MALKSNVLGVRLPTATSPPGTVVGIDTTEEERGGDGEGRGERR